MRYANICAQQVFLVKLTRDRTASDVSRSQLVKSTDSRLVKEFL